MQVSSVVLQEQQAKDEKYLTDTLARLERYAAACNSKTRSMHDGIPTTRRRKH